MIPRHLASQLMNRFKSARSVYLFGARQSGKTTLAKMTFPDLPYVSLEDPDRLDYVNSDPRGFLSQYPTGGIIDEPQRCPKLFSYLQGEIDNAHKQFLLTSSQNFLTMASITQSLAGRISLLNLFPLTKKEIDKKPLMDLDTLLIYSQKSFQPMSRLWTFILKGGYPEVHTTKEAIEYWHGDYVKTYLERDIRRIINVQDLGTFQRFLKLCAGRTGQVLNKASLSSDCGISESSCMRWLTLLELSGIIILLKPFYKNFNKRQTKSPKLLFVDTGLCCHLLGIRSVVHLETHPLMGALVETYTISELYKLFLNQGVDPLFYFWRDQHGHEIDLIIEMQAGTLIPIEIKSGQTIVQSMLEPLKKWCQIANIPKGYLLYGGTSAQTHKAVDVLPLSKII